MAKARVLIVDDSADLRSGLRAILERSGYAATEAADGPEGLAQAERLRPDVILLDVRMPGLDGYEVCRRLKANPATRSIPVIFVTMVEDRSLNRLAYQAGGAACIPKHVPPAGLLGVLAAVLASAKHRTNPKAGPDLEEP